MCIKRARAQTCAAAVMLLNCHPRSSFSPDLIPFPPTQVLG